MGKLKIVHAASGIAAYRIIHYWWVLLSCLSLPFNFCFAQSLHIERRFTMKDGLPSNQIYTILQDRQGFLWFATDNGVSRYDGKVFKNFDMADGLPDRDIFSVVQDGSGRIWVRSYKSGIAYFDPQTNRFYIPSGAAQLNTEGAAPLFNIRAMRDGLLVSDANGRGFIFRAKKPAVCIDTGRAWECEAAGKRYRLFPVFVPEINGLTSFYIAYHRSNRKTDSVRLVTGLVKGNANISYHLFNNTLYVTMDAGKQYIATVVDDRVLVDSIVINHKIMHTTIGDKSITLLAADRSVYVFDKEKLMLTSHTQLNEHCPYAYSDNMGNTWAATQGRGVYWLRPNYVQYLPTFSNKLDQRFRFISIDPADDIYMGNYFGEIVKITQSRTASVYYSAQRDRSHAWTRGVITSSGKRFIFFETGGYINASRPVLRNATEKLGRIKSCLKLNDSTIILGTVDTAGGGGLYKLNTITEVVSNLKTPVKWVSSLAQRDNRYIYLGSPDGLYKYDYEKKQCIDVFKNTALRSQRILFVTGTRNGLLVTATAGSGIYLLKDDRIIGHIPHGIISDDLPVCIASDSACNLWVGTKGGLVRLSYHLNENTLKLSSVNYAPMGSLLAADINALAVKGRRLYLATGQGAGVFDTHTALPAIEIYPVLTEVSINQMMYPVSDSFKLASDQRSIQLSFSGVDINGNLKLLQYSLDTAGGWRELPQNLLNLELGEGIYNLRVRAISESGYTSKHVLHLYFDIKRRLYKRWWFIALTALVIIITAIVFYDKMLRALQYKRKRHALRIQEERNRITADLHDEIGASISSLQMYSDIALQMLDIDTEKSRKMLYKISSKSYKISGNIADIIWSIRTPEEHSMTIEDRVKNIVHEMIGDSNIDFDIKIDKRVDSVNRNFMFKKNCVLILKEALNNSLKYGGPRFIAVALSMDFDYCTLIIKDDGRGFDVDKNAYKGNGLRIIKMRVAELNGNVSIASSEGAGVEIVAKFPIAKII